MSDAKEEIQSGELPDSAALNWIAHRQFLVAAEQKAQEDYDKTVIALSGGALAVSFAFVKDILGEGAIQQTESLVAAWLLWALSLTAVLTSFYLSRWALRRSIESCDAWERGEDCDSPGGRFVVPLRIMNAASALLFIAGVIAMTTFVAVNFRDRVGGASCSVTSPGISQEVPHPPKNRHSTRHE